MLQPHIYILLRRIVVVSQRGNAQKRGEKKGEKQTGGGKMANGLGWKTHSTAKQKQNKTTRSTHACIALQAAVAALDIYIYIYIYI
jgi:hypothetical protein